MGIELTCGNCQGRVVSETPGSGLVCPHCGVVIPGNLLDESAPNPDTMTVVDAPWVAAEAADAAADDETIPVDVVPATRVSLPGDSGPAWLSAAEPPLPGLTEPTIRDDALARASAAEFPAHPVETTLIEPPVRPEQATTLLAIDGGELPSLADSQPSLEPAKSASNAPVGGAEGGAAPPGPSPFAFKLLLSYASAVTIACIFLAYLVLKGAASGRDLLDLPDLEPRHERNKVTTLIYVSPAQKFPASHVLPLGQSRQFGSIRVTPLRVERGPLEFEYFDAAADITRPASDIVLKLVLRFENVSNDQEFTPLDAHLVFNKQSDSRRRAAAKANNFVCRADEKLDVARHVFVYDLSPDSTWLIRGENLGRDLKPGESVEAFIPTSEEGLDALAGPLLWRVHFRKGYNPTSLRGVTTVIEVPFRSEDIVPSTEQETT